MRNTGDIFGRECEPVLLAETVDAVLRDPVSSVYVEYVSVQGRTALTPKTGTMSHEFIRIPTRAWRNVVQEREIPGVDVNSRTYLIDAAPLDISGSYPRKGDFIVDDLQEYEVTFVEEGEIGKTRTHYVCQTTYRGNAKLIG